MTDSRGASRAAELVGLLAEPDRLRVVAALVLGHARHADLVAATGLDGRAVTAALDRLAAGGLIDQADDGGLRLRSEELKAAAIEAAAGRTDERSDDFAGFADDAVAVLRNFVRRGRIDNMPASLGKRRVVLDWVASRFEPGEVYHEGALNGVLAEVHDDTAALRRYLVDEGFMERREGFYWRAGGTFDVS